MRKTTGRNRKLWEWQLINTTSSIHRGFQLSVDWDQRSSLQHTLHRGSRKMIQYIFRFIPASVSLVWVIVSVSVLLFLYFQLSVLSRREPPGPRPLPLLGNLFQVDLKRLDQSLFDVTYRFPKPLCPLLFYHRACWDMVQKCKLQLCNGLNKWMTTKQIQLFGI